MTRPGLAVTSVGIDDGDEKGLSAATLRRCAVLVWWRHKRHAEVTPKMVRPVIERLTDGTLGLIALHSAHWATPFVEAMYERTRADAAKALKRVEGKVEVTYADPPRRYTLPKPGDRLTPYNERRGSTWTAPRRRPSTCRIAAYRRTGRTANRARCGC